MSSYKILKNEYKKYFEVINKILLDNKKPCNSFDFDSDFPLFNETYNIDYYMKSDLDTFSDENILDMMKNTLLVNTTYCRNNNASLKTLYNMANDIDKKTLISVYINFLKYLISYNKLIMFPKILQKESIKLDKDQDDISNFLNNFDYKDSDKIAELIDILAYNSIIKNYITEKLLEFKIDFNEEIKDFNISDQLLHLMFIKIPHANVNINIYNLTKQFISKIFTKSEYLYKSMHELNNKQASKIQMCNTCVVSKKQKYELIFSYDIPDDISDIKTTDKNLLKHIIHIALYAYETMIFYLKEENYTNIVNKINSFKNYEHDTNPKDSCINNQFIQKIHNFINKHSLQQFNLNNLIDIFTIYYDELYSILIDEETILCIKNQLYNLGEFVNLNNKKEYVDILVDNIIVNTFKIIKNNPDKIIIFKEYLKKFILLINKPNLFKKNMN